MKKVVTDQQKTTVKKVLDYIRRYWFYLGLSIVLAAVTVALTLYIPILTGRAVVKKPEILILDDSASALDFATDAALRKAIREMEGETTVFIVSQRAASIQHADRIVVLDDGKIVGLGTSEELLESCEVYQEIYNSQFKKQEGGKTA